jgi:hypothetical protein
MSNLTINKTATPLKLFTITDKNTVSNSSNFGYVLKMSTDLPAKNEMPTFSGKLKMPDGSIADVQPVHLQVSTHEESVKLLQESGMTKAEAEEMLRPKPVLSAEEEQKIMESSPAYIAAKQYSDSAQVEIVARDNNGQIVAVLWKDGSFMAENNSKVHGSTPAETRQNLLKMPNVHLERYNSNEKAPTRLEIQAEQIAFTKKHPELFQQIPDGLLS